MDSLAILTILVLMVPLALSFGFILMAPLASVATGFIVVSYQFLRLLEYMFITPDKDDELQNNNVHVITTKSTLSSDSAEYKEEEFISKAL